MPATLHSYHHMEWVYCLVDSMMLAVLHEYAPDPSSISSHLRAGFLPWTSISLHTMRPLGYIAYVYYIARRQLCMPTLQNHCADAKPP
jgi:hypothetical protein